jgi:hypothetical protein
LRAGAGTVKEPAAAFPAFYNTFIVILLSLSTFQTFKTAQSGAETIIFKARLSQLLLDSNQTREDSTILSAARSRDHNPFPPHTAVWQ